jgi:MFS family permease
MRRKAAPAFAGFFVLGLFWGSWAAVLPSVQDATGVSKGALGFALLFVTVGSVPTMLLVAGPAIDRFGTRAVAVACAGFAVATVLPGLATTLPTLTLALVVAGAGSGALDVGINARVSRLEDESGRRLMPAAHGTYSVGILIGAAFAGLARGAGVGRETILAAVAVAIALTSIALATEHVALGGGGLRRPRLEHTLVVMGLVGAAGFVVEGGTESWSALFLERQLDAQPAVSGLGPGLFGAAMAAGRFAGQAAHHVSDRVLFAGGAAIAAAGCVLVAVSPNALLALMGFALAGIGISTTAPVVFGAAGRGRRDAASAVATATTLGYLGLLVGPPLVGGVAELTGLRVSFLVLAGVAAAVTAAAMRLRLDPG